MNQFEEERRQRVLRNQLRLSELGLLENGLSGAAERRSKAEEQQQRAAKRRAARPAAERLPLEPERRSLRQRKAPPENVGMRLSSPG